MRGHNSERTERIEGNSNARKNEQGKDVRARMQALLKEEIDYDFSQFTMEEFVHWLEQRRGRKIECISYCMTSPSVSAAWVASDECDYVFYAKDAPPVFQIHSQLHEFAHMLCGHTAQSKVARLESLLEEAMGSTCPGKISVLLRSDHSDEIEIEAEVLASLIQERIMHHSRLKELTMAHLLESDFAIQMAEYLQLLG